MSARRSESAGDPDAPRRVWRWDRRRAWWVPDGDWGGDHNMVVMKRGRDPLWRAMARRVGCVAACDTADQAKSALEAWLDGVTSRRLRREVAQLPENELREMLAEARAGDPSRLQRSVALDDAIGSTATISWLVQSCRGHDGSDGRRADLREALAAAKVVRAGVERRLRATVERETELEEEFEDAAEDIRETLAAGTVAPKRERDGSDGVLSDVARAAWTEDPPDGRRVSRFVWSSRGNSFDLIVPPGGGLRWIVSRGPEAGAIMCWPVELDSAGRRRRVSRIELRVHYDVEE